MSAPRRRPTPRVQVKPKSEPTQAAAPDETIETETDTAEPVTGVGTDPRMAGNNDDTSQPAISDPWADDRRDFLAAIEAAEDVPYEDLLSALQVQGWYVNLFEVNAQPMPDSTVLVTFEIRFGPSVARLQTADTVTIRVPDSVVTTSLWARVNIQASAIFALFNRLPPPRPVETEQTQQSAAADPGRPVADPAPDNTPWEPLELVERRASDGVPIFYDLFALGETPDDIVQSFYMGLEKELATLHDMPQLAAIYTENVTAFDFVRQMMPERMNAFTDLLNNRRTELADAPPAATPAPGGRRPTPKR